MNEAELKCVNAHDRCFYGGPCPLCEPVRYRDAQGRFVRPEEADEPTDEDRYGWGGQG